MAMLDGLIKKLNGEDDEAPGNTGVTGGMSVLEAPPLQTDGPIPPGITPTIPTAGGGGGAAPSATDYGRLSAGYDAGKLNDPNKHDFKYDTARVLSRFDPKGGFTPDVINALNQELGGTYGSFSGAGDKLSLTGAKGAKDAGDFANQDWISALKAQNGDTKWNFGGGAVAEQEARQAAQGAPMGGGIGGGMPIANLLAGDASSNLSAALGAFPQANDDSLIRRLIAQLQQAGG